MGLGTWVGAGYGHGLGTWVVGEMGGRGMG